MPTRKALFVLFLLLGSAVSEATFYTYSFVDLSSCEYTIIGGERAEYSEIYMTWHAKAEALNNKLPPTDHNMWGVFYISDKTTDFAKVGICRTIYAPQGYPTGFECHSESHSNFPLASATYIIIDDKSALPSYRCASGCGRGVPTMIHDEGYEADLADNIQLRRLMKKFEKKCRRGNRHEQ